MSEKIIRGCIVRCFKNRQNHFFLAFLTIYGALSAQGGAYLPLIGPPSLRFETAMLPGKNLSWMQTLPAPATFSNQPPLITYVSTNNVSVPLLAKTQKIIMTPWPDENLSTNSQSQIGSANDLLVVTPEMLVDYFKPNQTNGTVTNTDDVRVLAPVDFTPPTSVASPSSKAIYISQ